MPGSEWGEYRPGRTMLDRKGATRSERAAVDRLVQRRDDTGDFGKARPAAQAGVEVGVGARQSTLEPERIRMQRAGEQLGDGRLFGNAARIHDDGAIAGLGDDAEIMRDHDDGGAESVLEFQHQIQIWACT